MSKGNIMADFAKSMASSQIIDLSRTDFIQSTGFDILDIQNATLDLETNKIHAGLAYGRILSIIGRSSTGKSTLAIQMAINMTKGLENSQIYHLDIERATKPIRIKNISGLTDSQLFDDNYYNLIQRDLSTETVHNLISSLYEFKKANKKKLLMDIVDSAGDVQKVLPPTVIILDSLALMTSKKNLDDDDIGGNMAGSQNANINNKLFLQNHGKLEEANIHLFIINHITTKINIGFLPVAADIAFLGQDEALKGGKSAVYLSDCMIKVTSGDKIGPGKKYDYGDTFTGFLIKNKLIKSRNAASGMEQIMVYDQNRGVQNELSNLEAFISNNLLGTGKIGNAKSYYFKELENKTFTRKTFLDLLKKDQEFMEVYKKYIVILKDLLVTKINETEVLDGEDIDNVVVKTTRKRKTIVEEDEQEEILE